MVRVTDEQVDFILSDFTKRGIVLEDLRDDLLDHMCCIIEDEMAEDDNFYRFYEYVLPRFFKEELAEIQRETDNLLRFKNFYSMKKTLKISGVLTALFTVTGAVFKTMHWPGAGVMILLGGFFFSFIFLPLLIAIKLKDEDSKTDKAVFSFGFFLAMVMSTGLIFKLMHWPGAYILMLSGVVTFTFIYVPLYFFTRIRRAELKFNTIVNSVLMMACGGIFFALFNLGHSQKYDDAMYSHHELHDNSLLIFESNDRLLESAENPKATELHDATKALNDQLEATVEKIVAFKSDEELSKEVTQLKKDIAVYNTHIKNVQEGNLVKVDAEPLSYLNRLEAKVKITVLAKMQQRIAVNENLYLTSIH